MNLRNVFLRPTDYIKAAKLLMAGLYFDFFQKKFKVGTCVFEVPPTLTTRRGRGYFALDLYERTERELVSKYITGNEKVLELGACIGVISCFVNSRLFRPQDHVVVEANPAIIPFLEQNRKINNSQFSVFNGVISDNNQEVFHFANSIVAGSLLHNGNGEKVIVNGKSLIDLEREFDIQFDALIIDIEGGEYDFLLKNSTKIRQFNLVIIENHPHLLGANQIAEYESVLENNGFALQETLDTSKVWKKMLPSPES